MPHVAGPAAAVPALVGQLYGVVAQLEGMFPGRKFTLDGHLVGSIGEVLAAERYGLTLLPMSERVHDAMAGDERRVQIKATQGDSVAIRHQPDYLLVLKLNADGSITEIYNGPGAAPWAEAGKRQSNGQRSIGLAKLRRLMADAPLAERIGVRPT